MNPLLAPPSVAAQLNQGCACRFLDSAKLQRQLEAEPALAGLAADIATTRPHLFSATMVFITRQQGEQMQALLAAIERVLALPAWREQALAQAPAIAQHDWGPRGVFFGFDFHLGETGPQLIEINTNAGGAMLNAALARAQTACCVEIEPLLQTASPAALENSWLAMFIEEWQRQRGSGMPRRIAIVDEAPAEQYLYPEFLLFQQLFAQAGIEAVIADPQQLRWEQGQLWHADQPLDMVYNRLTDFYLQQPHNAALAAAYESGAVVLTPHPRAHALYADKRHLARLSDEASLIGLGVPAADRAILLAGVPHTRIVSAQLAEQLWAERRQLFFKPAGGFGSRAAYRGDKLTRRVWGEILAGDYVAQRIAAPSERLVAVADAASELKLDVRAYAYAGAVQLFAARLYSGQTTNFRTPGGGFAPVFVIPEQEEASCASVTPRISPHGSAPPKPPSGRQC